VANAAAAVVIMVKAFDRGILARMGWLSVAVLPVAAAASGIPTGSTLEEIVVTATRVGLFTEWRAASEGVVLAVQLEGRPLLRPGEVREGVPVLIVTQHSGDGHPACSCPRTSFDETLEPLGVASYMRARHPPAGTGSGPCTGQGRLESASQSRNARGTARPGNAGSATCERGTVALARSTPRRSAGCGKP
jgi:hypothetical protein